MKPSSAYVFRIVATSAAGTCTSADTMLMTGPVPAGIARAVPTVIDAARHARGFIVISSVGGLSFIADADGATVWWSPNSAIQATRALMSWDGRDMYFVGMSPGNVRRVSMDGLSVDSIVSGLARAHHDLTAIPTGIAALLELPASATSTVNALVERSPDGTLTTVVANLATLSPSLHPNSIHYHLWDDSYTIGDGQANSYVKITRKGALVWQFGGSNPSDPSKLFQGVASWQVNHGHHLLPDGTFAFMNNGTLMNEATARVFKLDTTTMTATSLLSYRTTDMRSMFLGDVQCLPNGNFLVTYMESAQIREIDPSGQVVAQYAVGGTLGYSQFRTSLYGPPPD